ncbi:MAG: AMP-binding protein [Atopobiaceae bacterium]|nr:AMP-binding protein [Atopobiaceae bacterium]
MKLSFSTIGCPAYAWTYIYSMAKDLGFDGIEIRGVAGNAFAPTAQPFLPRQRARTRALLDRIGLEISCFSTSCALDTDEERMRTSDEVVQYLELASEMNSPFVRLLLSRDIRPSGNVNDDAVIDYLRDLADMASIYDVTILVETESDYADTARLARVLDAVDSPYVAALWDLHHPYRIYGESAQTSIDNLGHHLRYCQIKDSVIVDGHVQYRMMGEGDMPLPEMLDALQASGYDGYVSFEWVRKWARDVAIGEPGIVFPQFMNYMRDYLAGGFVAPSETPEEAEEAPTLVSAAALTGELQHSLTGPGTYPWPKNHLIDLTFPQVLDHICELYPDQYAFRFTEFDYSRTYPEFREDVNEFARALIAMGVQPGDKVAIWATNVPGWFLTFWAAVKIGAVLVTVNTGYKIHELEYLLRQSDTHTLVMVDEYKGTSYLDIVDELVPELAEAGRPGVWSNPKLPFLKNVVTIDGPHPGCYSWEEALALAPRVKQAEVDRRCAAIKKDDVCNMQYTSGTTGFPKGVMLTHYNVVNNGKAIGDCMDLSTSERMMIQVPMFHCFGMVLAMTASMTHGVTMSPISAFSPRKGLDCINREKITCFHGVPTMFIAMMNTHPQFEQTDFSHMRTGIMAGSPCPIEKMREVVEKMHMRDICITYGQTEASPATTMSKTTDTLEQRVTTVGLPIFGVECKIIDPETGDELGDNMPGEFCSRGYNTMKGYYKMPEATAATIDKDGWLHSGDILLRQSDGYYRVTGRVKDMIIRGGENVYPKEIEDFLYTFPKTKDVQVIGVPDKVYGEVVLAEIILAEGETATEEEVKEFCRARIAKEKVPAYVRFVDGFPMNEAGKIQKYKMREEAVELLGLQDAASIETA